MMPDVPYLAQLVVNVRACPVNPGFFVATVVGYEEFIPPAMARHPERAEAFALKALADWMTEQTYRSSNENGVLESVKT